MLRFLVKKTVIFEFLKNFSENIEERKIALTRISKRDFQFTKFH